MIKRFEEVEGRYIEKIIGQDRFAFAQSDTSDFYDLIEWSETGNYPGSTIMFFDFESGNVYRPFEKKSNVIYSNPVYSQGFCYFLQGDYGEKKITLYRCFPGSCLEKETELSTDEVNLYNLRLIGNGVHIISQDENFECYYPEKISFPKKDNETAMLIEDERIFFEAWIEEGWDSEKNCATDAYRYYEKLIVRDFNGNMLSEEVGSLHQASDGTWWLG